MKYILKVWFFTCLIAPLMILLEIAGLNFSTSDFEDFVFLYLFFIGLGLLFSLPTFIIMLFIKFVYSDTLNVKFILNSIGVLGTFISFFILDNSFFENLGGIIWVLSYALSISFFIWFFKIEKPDKPTA
ncbi:MAG: hypothetical protein WCY89_09415 [Flavobacteriaceae bacterium]